jgi:hypothetical protein
MSANSYSANIKKYNLALCELHFPQIHGKNESSDANIETHYLLIDRFDPVYYVAYSNFSDDEIIDEINFEEEVKNDIYNDLIKMSGVIKHSKVVRNTILKLGSKRLGHHPTIRNYYNIIRNIKYLHPQIAECIELPTHETIVIIKTIWLRLIQRTWKKVYKQRIEIYKQKMNPTNIYKTQVGIYKNLLLPGLKGMLAKLNTKHII